MTHVDLRPELRLSSSVLHLHSTFGPRPRHPQMWQERLERVLIALMFALILTTAAAGLIFLLIPALGALLRRFLGG